MQVEEKKEKHTVSLDDQVATGWARIKCSCGEDSDFFKNNFYGDNHRNKWIVKHAKKIGFDPEISGL